MIINLLDRRNTSRQVLQLHVTLQNHPMIAHPTNCSSAMQVSHLSPGSQTDPVLMDALQVQHRTKTGPTTCERKGSTGSKKLNQL